ncbi:MAG: hypothetical protein QM726_12445 [Chitinophagaceae bacterium]
MKSINLILLIGILISCNSQQKEGDSSNSQQENTTKDSPMNCYRYASATDTISLKLIHVGEFITGLLVYSLKEKDKNKGTIQGNMRGDILVAKYTFMSEGIQSTRQVAFKKEGNSFVEGYGDFNSLDSLSFNTSMKLTEIECQ